MADSVSFIAAVNKVTTLADGGLRVTFDMPESAIVEAAWMMQAKRDGVALKIECTPHESNEFDALASIRPMSL